MAFTVSILINGKSTLTILYYVVCRISCIALISCVSFKYFFSLRCIHYSSSLGSLELWMHIRSYKLNIKTLLLI